MSSCTFTRLEKSVVPGARRTGTTHRTGTQEGTVTRKEYDETIRGEFSLSRRISRPGSGDETSGRAGSRGTTPSGPQNDTSSGPRVGEP